MILKNCLKVYCLYIRKSLNKNLKFHGDEETGYFIFHYLGGHNL
jgi:hypothetical protein